MRELKLWHLMFVVGVLGGLMVSVHEALPYVNHPAAFVLGLFLGGFVSWIVVSAVLILFRTSYGRQSLDSSEGHPLPR